MARLPFLGRANMPPRTTFAPGSTPFMAVEESFTSLPYSAGLGLATKYLKFCSFQICQVADRPLRDHRVLRPEAAVRPVARDRASDEGSTRRPPRLPMPGGAPELSIRFCRCSDEAGLWHRPGRRAGEERQHLDAGRARPADQRVDVPDQSRAPPLCRLHAAPARSGCGRCRRRRASAVWNCSVARRRLRHHAQNLAGTRRAAAAKVASPSSGDRQRRRPGTRTPTEAHRLFRHRLARLGETWEHRGARWRRCLITTAPIEIAARAAIAIRIGTRGEEPPSSLEEARCSAGWALGDACPAWSPAVAPCLGYPGRCRRRSPCLDCCRRSQMGPPTMTRQKTIRIPAFQPARCPEPWRPHWPGDSSVSGGLPVCVGGCLCPLVAWGLPVSYWGISDVSLSEHRESKPMPAEQALTEAEGEVGPSYGPG